MYHASLETQHDIMDPVTLGDKDEAARAPESPRSKTLLDSLVFLYVVGLALSPLAMRQNAAMSQPATATMAPIATEAQSVPHAPVPSSLPQSVDWALSEAYEQGPRERIVGQSQVTLSRRTANVSEGNVDKPPQEDRDSASPFNEFEAMVAIDKAAQEAQVCFGAKDPRPIMRVAVTFANSGRAKRAEVETGPYRNTPQGDCIVRMLHSAWVHPFDGSAVTVHRAIHIL